MEEINKLINDTKETVIKLKEEIEALDKQAMDLGKEFQEANKKRDEIENKESAQYELQESISNEMLEKLRGINEKSKELKDKAIEKINIVESKCEADKEKLAKKILEDKNKKTKIEKEIEQFSELIRKDKEENNIDEADQIMQNRMKKILALKSELPDIDKNISESMKAMNKIDNKIKFLNYDNIEKLEIEKYDKDLEDEKDDKDSENLKDGKDSEMQQNFLTDKEYERKKELKEKGSEIIKDLGKDYKNVDFTPEKIENFNIDKKDIEFASREAEEGKKIHIKIIESKEVVEYIDNIGKKTIPLSSLIEEKGNIYKRLEIGKMCRKVIKDTKGKRRLGIMLKRKINPEIVKALDATGNEDLVQDYIESIYTKKELPFELTHDLSELSMIEKLQMRKYTKSEEKCGAKILGKIFSRNKALPEGEKGVEQIENEGKEQLAQHVQEIMEKDEKVIVREQLARQEIERRKARREAKENNARENATFVPKVNGKNAEIAEKYRQESKREMEELLNNLGNEYDDTDKFSMADYMNRYGVEAAKKRYSKQFASAEVNLSVKEMIDEKHEKELPGNQQIAEQSEEEAR